MRSTKSGNSRQKFWQDLIARQEQSGLGVRAFCVQQGVTEQSFYGWKKRLAAESVVRFALVETGGSSGQPAAALELELASGERLRIGPGVDGATLRTVLAVLRDRA